MAWSFGALVTLDFALDNPGRVRSLTLIEPPALWVLDRKTRNSREIQETETLLRSLRGDITEAQLEGFLVAVGICPPGVSARELPQWPVWLRHRLSLRNSQAPLDHRDSPRRLISFRHPVLLVTGTGTAPFLLRIIETLQAQLPQARTVEMPGAHAPQIVAMDRFLHELATFLANLK
ncbi:MAG: alpha/beta hydrolase [Chloroflexi bacterium]|nr:alpha/beta hydrolase [Chloroflexota bacterium]